MCRACLSKAIAAKFGCASQGPEEASNLGLAAQHEGDGAAREQERAQKSAI